MSDNDNDNLSTENSEDDLENEDDSKFLKNKSILDKKKNQNKTEADQEISDSESEDDLSDFDSESNIILQERALKKSLKRKNEVKEVIAKKKLKKAQEVDIVSENDDNIEILASEEETDSETEGLQNKQEQDGVWEDIYGRLRSKNGTVVTNSEGKYIPPAIRARMDGDSEDKKRKEKLDRLRKQVKGLLNRLAESNMHNIAGQIESLYMNNSRNDMNETLNGLVIESLISTVLTPERLLMEHVVLVAILHANVGTEVGANFLQTIVRKFDHFSTATQNVEDKSLDNTVNILAQLYNFKVFDAKLLYEILQKLADHFDEKNVECILHILRSVGFGLRKDDPIALKNLILELQKQAAGVNEGTLSNFSYVVLNRMTRFIGKEKMLPKPFSFSTT